jgi:hypothetical protein
VAEFTTRNAGTEVEIAYGNAVVLEVVGKVVVALCHGSDKDCYAFVLVEAGDVVADAHNFRVETERDLAAVGWEVVCYGVLDDFDELLLRRSGADLVAMEQLHHQTSKSLERSGNADGGADSNEHVLGCLNVNLKLARLVDGRIQKGEQTLTMPR